MSCEKSKEKTKRSYEFLPFLTESHINENKYTKMDLRQCADEKPANVDKWKNYY